MPFKSAIDERLLEFLERPTFRMDLVRGLRSHPTTVQARLDKLWREGRILRSRTKVSASFVDSKPGVGQYWNKFTGFLWVKADSSAVTPSGIATLDLPRTERFTLNTSKKQHNVMFVPFSDQLVEKVREGWVSQKDVLAFFKKRGIGAAPGEVAEYLKVPLARASGALNKLRKAGLLERRGYWNQILGRETPFMGRIRGYVYGLPGTDQAKKRIEEGQGLYSPHVNAVLIEIRKDSNQKRFTSYGKFEDEIGQYETLKAIKILTQIYPSLVTATIGGQGFIYDKQSFSAEDIERQNRYWEHHISIKKRSTGAIGHFHEAFTQHAISLALKSMQAKTTFWRRLVKGKEHYDIKLSNAKEIDRVLQIDFQSRDKLLWRHCYPIECKFYRGGATSEHLKEFIDKLRFSTEFGEEISLQEGNQTLQVHVIKQNVHPILISPYFKKETHAQAKKYHIELLPTWLLAKLAGETLGKKLDMKKMFDDYTRQGGGNIEAYFAEFFKRKPHGSEK